MPLRKSIGAAGLLLGGLLLVSCSSDPQAPPLSSSVSGTVVFAQSGTPAAGVEVTMEQCDGTSMMMHHREWSHTQHAMTDHHGAFHFEYRHEPQHRYRVRAGGMDPGNMCYLDGGARDDVVLRIEEP